MRRRHGRPARVRNPYGMLHALPTEMGGPVSRTPTSHHPQRPYPRGFALRAKYAAHPTGDQAFLLNLDASLKIRRTGVPKTHSLIRAQEPMVFDGSMKARRTTEPSARGACTVTDVKSAFAGLGRFGRARSPHRTIPVPRGPLGPALQRSDRRNGHQCTWLRSVDVHSDLRDRDARARHDAAAVKLRASAVFKGHIAVSGGCRDRAVADALKTATTSVRSNGYDCAAGVTCVANATDSMV